MSVFHIVVLSLLSIGLVGLASVYLFFRWKYRFWKNQDIKVTSPTFPLGDVSQIGFSKHLGVVFKDIYDQFKGERYNGMWVIHRPFIMVRDPELIKVMFVRDFMHFRDRGLYVNEYRDPLSANLFFERGLRWRNLRTKLTPSFTSGKMKNMFEIMVERGEKLRDVLGGYAEEGKVIKTKDYAVRYTHDVVGGCILGVQPASLENNGSIFTHLGKKVFEPTWIVIIKAAFAFLVPGLADFLKMVNTPTSVTKFFLKLFKDVKEYRDSLDTKPQDFTQVLIQLHKQGYLTDADCNGNEEIKRTRRNKFSYENAVAQAFIFWVGGFESSATTIQFALYEMCLNPEIQDRARAEVVRILEKYEGKVTYEGVHEMEYLSRVVDETLRKYPPVSILNRECSKTYKIPESDVVIQKGTPVLISVLGIHHDPEHFPDPEKFDPERFTEEGKSTRHNYAYLPFGDGPHGCIGQRFALLQIRVALASLLSNYKFEVSEETPKKARCGRKLVIYTVRSGIPLRITKLKEE